MRVVALTVNARRLVARKAGLANCTESVALFKRQPCVHIPAAKRDWRWVTARRKVVGKSLVAIAEQVNICSEKTHWYRKWCFVLGRQTSQVNLLPAQIFPFWAQPSPWQHNVDSPPPPYTKLDFHYIHHPWNLINMFVSLSPLFQCLIHVI